MQRAPLPYQRGQPSSLDDFLANASLFATGGGGGATSAARRGAYAASAEVPPFVFDGGGLLHGTSLGADVQPDPPLFEIERGGVLLRQLSISPPLAGAHPHFHGAAFNALVTGMRRWALVPPHAAQFSREPALHHFSRLRHGSDAAAAALRGANGGATGHATPEGRASSWLDAVQRPGDVLYVPDGWQHATLSLADSVAVAVEFV